VYGSLNVLSGDFYTVYEACDVVVLRLREILSLVSSSDRDQKVLATQRLTELQEALLVADDEFQNAFRAEEFLLSESQKKYDLCLYRILYFLGTSEHRNAILVEVTVACVVIRCLFLTFLFFTHHRVVAGEDQDEPWSSTGRFGCQRPSRNHR
jgi:hypothetical protein